MHRKLAPLFGCLTLLAACGGGSGSGPRIASFAADPAQIAGGGLSVLRWRVEGATSLSIDPDVGDVSSVSEIGVRPRADTTYSLHARNASGETTATTKVSVSGQTTGVSALLAVLDSEARAGVPARLTVTAKNGDGSTARDYSGTVHFSSSDPAALLPADAAFTSSDGGSKTFAVTFITPGGRTVTVADQAHALSVTSNSSAVGPGSAASCKLIGLPDPATAGAQLAPHVAIADAFGNVATSYTGTITLASSDGAATLPAPYAYLPGDAGDHAFALKLASAGSQSVTASDAANTPPLSCSLSLSVKFSVAGALVFSGLPASAAAGDSLDFTLTAVDADGHASPTYAGAVTFTSSAKHASLPASYTFTSGDQGAHHFTASIGDAGSQQIFATDAAGVPVSGSSPVVLIHGLTYTDPSPGLGKVRLVRNPASTGATLQLDLIAAASFAGYSVALNLPADAAKVKLGSTPLAPGSALNPGSAPAAYKAALPTKGPLANALVSGLSQKAAGSGAVASDASITAGQIFYTLTVQPIAGAAAGVLVDPAALGPRFRATVRDHLGDEQVGTADFAVGKLEVH